MYCTLNCNSRKWSILLEVVSFGLLTQRWRSSNRPMEDLLVRQRIALDTAQEMMSWKRELGKWYIAAGSSEEYTFTALRDTILCCL